MRGQRESIHTLQQTPAQAFHQCTDANAFRTAFEREMGISIDRWLADVAYTDRVAAVILGGSIPLGIGSATSDVDLILVIDDPTAIKDGRPGGSGAPPVHGHIVGESEDAIVAETFAVMSDRITYLQFVTLGELSRLSRQLALPEAWLSLSAQRMQVLSRVKMGWMLTETERFRRACSDLLEGRAFEIQCAVRYLAYALWDFEQAKSSLSDDVAVALYLGRSCVQRVLAAYMAAKGSVYIGNEWLKMVSRAADARDATATSMPSSLIKKGIELLFPPLTDVRGEGLDYLKKVAEVVSGCKRRMESDRAMRAAFQLSPQVYEPVWPEGVSQ